MAQGVPLVADSYQLAKMLTILRNSKVRHVHGSPGVNPITSQSHPFQIFTSHFFISQTTPIISTCTTNNLLCLFPLGNDIWHYILGQLPSKQ